MLAEVMAGPEATARRPGCTGPRIRSIVGAVAVAASLLTAACAQPEPKGGCMSRVSFTFAGVDKKTAADFETAFCAAVDDINAWWGTPFDGKYTVDTSPEYTISKALVPAWRGHRGEMEFPADRVNDTRAAISHEVTHVIAPNQNRFLAEGLAVYVQATRGTNPAFPNFGRPLAEAVQPYIDAVPLADLDAISTPQRLEIDDVIDGKGAYLVAGSFVEWLIEKYGMDEFRALYSLTPLRPCQEGHGGAPARWAEIYGKDLPTLQAEWRRAIGLGEG